MKVLVTGSSGFVGRAFVEHYRPNHHVLGIDIKTPSRCDVRRFFRDESFKFDLVIHAAAVVGGRQMIDSQPLHLAAEDLSIDSEMWRWAMRTKPARIVYFSSSAVYPTYLQSGNVGEFRLSETHTDVVHGGHPDASYGRVKQIGEYMAGLANEMGIKTHVFRPFSGYGELQDMTYPFMSIMNRCLCDIEDDGVDIWSDTVRDFVHIDDVVGCVEAVLDAEYTRPVNICTGRATSFYELATLGGAKKVNILKDMPTGVAVRVGSPKRMNQFYTAKVTLEEGIERAQRFLLQ